MTIYKYFEYKLTQILWTEYSRDGVLQNQSNNKQKAEIFAYTMLNLCPVNVVLRVLYDQFIECKVVDYKHKNTTLLHVFRIWI